MVLKLPDSYDEGFSRPERPACSKSTYAGASDLRYESHLAIVGGCCRPDRPLHRSMSSETSDLSWS